MNHFPAKVLLLGEYTILSGSKALALPYWDYQGTWSFDEIDSEARARSRESLLQLAEHPSSEYIDQAAFAADVQKGLWFDSTIPQGYGVGSSGAVIAALLDRYGKGEKSLYEAKHALARLEDHFHGSSSGLDPLVSHVQSPLLIHNFNEVEVLVRDLDLSKFFLLNTGKPRQTGPLVKIYQEKLKDSHFKQACADVLAREVNFAIDAVVSGDDAHLFHHLWHISKFQWEFFPEMIPTQMRGIWTSGLESGDYTLKLCGAGGGGFLLGYSKTLDLRQLQARIPMFDLRSLK